MLSYFIAIAVSATVGFGVGSLLAASKVAYLYSQVAESQAMLDRQAKIVRNLTLAIRLILEATEERLAITAPLPSLPNLREALARCDGLLSMEPSKTI